MTSVSKDAHKCDRRGRCFKTPEEDNPGGTQRLALFDEGRFAARYLGGQAECDGMR